MGIPAAGTGMKFERNAANPIETDVIIVDEMSMVDIFLMNSLLSAAVPGTRFVFVGDCQPASFRRPGKCAEGYDCFRIF